MENLLNMEELAEILDQLEYIDEVAEDLEGETLASQKRYEEIIKKHKNDPV